MFGRNITVDVTRVKIIFPIKPGLKLRDSLQYHATTFDMAVLEFEFDETNFTVSIEINPEYENIEQAVQKYLKIFAERSTNITSENQTLRGTIQAYIEQKKKRIMKDEKTLDALMQKVSIPYSTLPFLTACVTPGQFVSPPGRMLHFVEKIKSTFFLILKLAKLFPGSWKVDDKG
jgi:hypothetical protein